MENCNCQSDFIICPSNANIFETHYEESSTSTTIDFGEVEVGTKKCIDFQMKNYCEQPLIVQLIGIYAPQFNFNRIKLCKPLEDNEDKGFAAYMKDVQTQLEKDPPFSLTENYLNFDGVPMSETACNNKCLVTSFTNHTCYWLHIEWEDDEFFKITPKIVDLPSFDSVLFECTFTPNKPDFIFAKILHGNVFFDGPPNFIDERKPFKAPLNISLRLLGNSFFDNSLWLPQLEIIPTTITLEANIPNVPTYGTFMLNVTGGFLPVSFQFIPPQKSNFIIKPMLGLVTDYKIIVAQLQTVLHQEPKAFIECWTLILNGQNNHQLTFYINGYSQLPNLMIGDQNIIKFDHLQPGCLGKVIVPIYNTCPHVLRYEFKKHIEDKHIQIEKETGVIAANETIYLKWFFWSQLKVAQTRNVVICAIYPMLNFQIVHGKPTEIKVEVYASSQYAELCSIPNECNYGNLLCLTKFSTQFKLHNFGGSIVHFVLSARELCGKECTDMQLTPNFGSVHPGRDCEIFLDYISDAYGQHEITISYKVRICEDSHELGSNYAKDVYKFFCNCLYPIVQVSEIAFHNFGPLFSKPTLWDMLNIEKFNEALKIIKSNETIEISMDLPDFEMLDEQFYAILMLQNVSCFDAALHLKRLKQCTCPMTEMGGSLSKRARKFACIHRDMLTVTISDHLISSNSIQVMQINVKYTIFGKTKMTYVIELSHGRKIILNFFVNVLSETDLTLSKFASDFHMTMQPVALSEKEPQIQCFWLYNNTGEASVPYLLDTTVLDELNNEYGFNVITCLNSNGYMYEYSAEPLMFYFNPIEHRSYQVSMPIQIGDEMKTFTISADGVYKFRGEIKLLRNIPSMTNIDVPIMLSVDHITIPPFPVWSSTTFLIFIKNLSKNSLIGYSWKRQFINDVIEVRSNTNKGVLKPRETHPIVIRVISFNRACKLRMQMPCKLLDHSQYYEHKKSVAAYNKREHELKEEFTITEAGITYPINNVQILPYPGQFYTTLSMDLQVTSIRDRDLHHSAQEQFIHSQQYNLRYGDYAFNLEALLPRKDPLEKPIRIGVYKDDPPDEESPIKRKYSVYERVSNNKLLTTTVECILADVIFSNLFKEILKQHKKLPSPYYHQFKMAINNPLEEGESLTATKKVASATRDVLIKGLYQQPQPPILGEVFHEIIIEAIHNIFHLGPINKKRPKINQYGQIKTQSCEDFDCECKL